MNLSIEERNQLVLENQKLIHYLLRPYRNKVSSPLYDYEDLVQVANEAMCLAIDKLDTQSSKFSTWISSYILGYVNTIGSRMPVHITFQEVTTINKTYLKRYLLTLL